MQQCVSTPSPQCDRPKKALVAGFPLRRRPSVKGRDDLLQASSSRPRSWSPYHLHSYSLTPHRTSRARLRPTVPMPTLVIRVMWMCFVDAWVTTRRAPSLFRLDDGGSTSHCAHNAPCPAPGARCSVRAGPTRPSITYFHLRPAPIPIATGLLRSATLSRHPRARHAPAWRVCA